MHTNDPERPIIPLTLTANILTNSDAGAKAGAAVRAGKRIGPVFVSPADRLGLTLQPGQKGKLELTITVEKEPLKILRVEGGEQHFIIRIETLEPGKRYKLLIETAHTEKPGSYDEPLRIITDSNVLPSFPITLFMKVLPPQ